VLAGVWVTQHKEAAEQACSEADNCRKKAAELASESSVAMQEHQRGTLRLQRKLREAADHATTWERERAELASQQHLLRSEMRAEVAAAHRDATSIHGQTIRHLECQLQEQEQRHAMRMQDLEKERDKTADAAKQTLASHEQTIIEHDKATELYMSLKTRLEEQEETIRSLRERVNGVDELRSERDRHAAALQQTVASHEQTIIEHDKATELYMSLKTRLEEQEETIRSLRERVNGVDELRSERDRHAAALQQTVASHEETMEEAFQAVDALDVRLKEEEEINSLLRAELQQAKEMGSRQQNTDAALVTCQREVDTLRHELTLAKSSCSEATGEYADLRQQQQANIDILLHEVASLTHEMDQIGVLLDFRCCRLFFVAITLLIHVRYRA
jgi:hypothetical protein